MEKPGPERGCSAIIPGREAPTPVKLPQREDQRGGRSVVGRRLTVAQAADALGISANAVRMRVRRGSLPSEKDDEGRVWVLVSEDEQESVSDQVSDQHATDQQTNELTEELREQIAYLKRQVEAEREAHAEESRRKDHIIAALVNRIPELEPGAPPAERPEPAQEPQDAPQTGSNGPGRVDTPQDQTQPGEGDSGPLWHSTEIAPEDPPRRPWWQRWFGG